MLCFFLLPLQALAQDFIQIKGLVIDEKTEDPIPYATVRIKGAPVGTITDRGGNFSFWISKGYSQRKILFSSVGYYSKEVPVLVLSRAADHRIRLAEDVRELATVTVISEKQLTALEVLKKAVKRIPQNYINEQHTFDAYYRELVTENGAVIKYADGAVTFDQSPYDGKKYSREDFGGQQLQRQGSWLGGYSGIYRIGDRLHDHFGHKTADTDRVLIHEARTSLNHSREQLMPNIEGGPLATLSKDLVKYLRHFIAPGNYRAYQYELAEIPDGKGEWDYLIRFKPTKPAAALTGDASIVGGGIRKHVMVGEIYVDQESFVIKKLNYRVGTDYRSHICSLGFMEIIHYGYQVAASYNSYNDKWQLENLKRVDEFLFPDTLTNKITPFSAISQIWVTREKSDLLAVADSQSFVNKNTNYFQDYPGAYHAEFWAKYEQQFPEARISDSLKMYMEDRLSLEAQFALKSERDDSLKPPLAPIKKTLIDFSGNKFEDNHAWLEDLRKLPADEDILEYQVSEKAYAANYLLPLGKLKNDLQLELRTVAEEYQAQDTVGVSRFKAWSQYKSRSAGKRMNKQSRKYKVKTLHTTDQNGAGPTVTLFYLSNNRDKSLGRRPLLVKVAGTENTGTGIAFDPYLMPLLRRGIIIAYVHLKGADESAISWYTSKKSKQHKLETDNFIRAITYLRKNKLGNPTQVFFEARDAGAAILAAALNRRPDLCQGTFFHSIQADPVSLIRNAGEGSEFNLPKQWKNNPKEALIKKLLTHAPYQNLKAQRYPRMALFDSKGSSEQYQSIKMLARLRTVKTDENILLLMEDLQADKDPVKTIALKYTLLFQWLEDLRQTDQGPRK